MKFVFIIGFRLVVGQTQKKSCTEHEGKPFLTISFTVEKCLDLKSSKMQEKPKNTLTDPRIDPKDLMLNNSAWYH